jgi:hypothetical protein
MNAVKQFFLFCSGADQEILKKCPSDINKYVGIGGTVFFTGVLAFFSAGYAIYTVFDNWFMSLVFGLVWGLMIFNLDRYIVSSMKSRGSWWRDFFVAFPRLLMAILLALVISKPLELKIFEKEINAELITMEQEVYLTQESTVKGRFDNQIKDYRSQIADLQSEIDKQTALRDTLDLMALQEADGTGGSGKKNLGPIYRAKRAEADKAQAELKAMQDRILPLIAEKQTAINDLETQMQNEIDNLERSAYGGMAARMEALDRLGKESQAIFYANIFIMLLFIAIETAPIFVKLISSRSPYDHLLYEQEYQFEMASLASTTLLNNETKNKIKFETETSVYKTQQKIQLEKELEDQRMAQIKEKLNNQSVDWKEPLWTSDIINAE